MTLPPGWAEARHPTTGQVYYYHSVSNPTQWHHPASEPSTHTHKQAQPQQRTLPPVPVPDEPVTAYDLCAWHVSPPGARRRRSGRSTLSTTTTGKTIEREAVIDPELDALLLRLCHGTSTNTTGSSCEDSVSSSQMAGATAFTCTGTTTGVSTVYATPRPSISSSFGASRSRKASELDSLPRLRDVWCWHFCRSS